MRPPRAIRRAAMSTGRWTTLGVLAAVLMTAGPGCSRPSKDTPSPPENTTKARHLPNIVLFSIDTLRADHLAAYGYHRPTSPNIDAFAREAILFENATSQAPTTTPAHMSIWTGLAPSVHRQDSALGDENSGLGPAPGSRGAIVTFPELLKKHGYLTVGFHGGAMVDDVFGFGRGFDLYTTRLISNHWHKAYHDAGDLKPIADIARIAGERRQPLFLFLHHYVCHEPYVVAPMDLRLRFLPEPVPGLATGPDDATLARIFDRLEPLRILKGSQHGEVADALGSIVKSFWDGVEPANPEHLNHVTSLYDAGILYADWLFGQVVSMLKKAGLYENTIFVLLSDHGEEFFEHGGKGHRWLFVETLHVPLVIRIPERYRDVASPKRIPTPVRTMDVFPTLFDLIGLATERPVQGVSLLPLMKTQPSPFPPPPLVSVASRHGGFRLGENGWVFVRQRGHRISEGLFAPEQDPGEQRNLATERPDITRKMHDRTQALLAEADALRTQLLSLDPIMVPSADPSIIEALGRMGNDVSRIKTEPEVPEQARRRLFEELRALGYVQ